MSSRDYPRLSIEDFGAQLLDNGDLDPIYVALAGHDRVQWNEEQVCRFLVAYWCLYHAGAASYISEFTGEQFWQALMAAARNEGLAPTGQRWPRGHERRHWRGVQAVDSCRELGEKYKFPEEMVTGLVDSGHTFAAVSAKAQTHRGFGPWIAFKICDMLDRCIEHKVDFTTDAAFNGIFKDPWEAALQLWRLKYSGDRLSAMKPKDERTAVATVVDYLTDHFSAFDAPPLGDRPPNVQEIETILCKWKSHMNGHYPPRNDILEIHAGLDSWVSTCGSVAEFKRAMPPR